MKPRLSLHHILLLLLLWLLPLLSDASEELSDASTDELESQLLHIDSELKELARFSLRSGAGNIGWISMPRQWPGGREWVKINLTKDTLIDQIILVPVLWNDAEKGPQASGFPAKFKIIAGTTGDTTGQIIAQMGPKDNFLPRIAPLVINIQPTVAAWVRIESTHMSKAARTGKPVFGLSEIMLFNGDRNVALAQPVKVSSTVGGWGANAIYKESLTDGFTPFLMDARGAKSSPYLAFYNSNVNYSLDIDLGSSYPIDEIRIHSADASEHIPQINPIDFGIPYHFIISGSNRKDFSEATSLLNYQRQSVYGAGPILTRNVTRHNYRYIRLAILASYKPPTGKATERALGLAELEVISDGENVAQGKKVTFHPKKKVDHKVQTSITDGRNHFGEILSTREWMNQLARRHDLNIQRPLIALELSQKYIRQKSMLQRMIWIASLLTAGILISILIGWSARMRAIMKTRERIAANLHDELSANLHALALLGDMAQKNIQTPGKLTSIIERIQQLSNRSRNAARHCTNMLQANMLGEDLPKEMDYTAERLMADTPHELRIEGADILQQLPKRRRNDLALFYKECLTNIARHAEASECSTELTATPQQIELVVTDNGMGTAESPPSLKRRARLLKAQLRTETPEGGGTRILLNLQP